MNYTENCSNCEFRKDCENKHQRMYKGRCYIDAIAEKLKIKKRDVYNAMDSYEWYTSVPYTAPNDKKFKDYWCKLSESQKKEYFKDRISDYNEDLKQYDDYEYQMKSAKLKIDDTKIVRVLVAIFNFAYDAWRDTDEVRCMICGRMMQNNSKHNRKYCGQIDCFDWNKMLEASTPEKQIICIDCGIPVKLEPKDNKSCRCSQCQKKADKEATRIRVAKYRAKKKAATA